ncbi:MAG: UDP-N-acetylmuramate:L-alanyl-gamma-D-glutamyl-meso-diaminopimelate ligase [Deltaproteobacteria bacterium]|nr:UDP-N-acetylmuramate:L-alanyl-gamma-D-glutamyl-meso-diaminopimelate ligase [Deltaproteobacteria bacterium]
MHVHLIAVAGTGMGALAGLFKALGHDVSGSDINFDPPMGPALERWGIRLMKGFDPAHLQDRPDLVVVGNVCRSDNPEARAAIDGGLRTTDIAHALADLALRDNSPLVVAGTHGKTTTTAMCAWLLHDLGSHPGFLIGGLPKNFDESFRVAGEGRKHLPIADGTRREGSAPSRGTPFVVEGDEYDTAFFEKTPKFWHYLPEVAILTSIEHDHVDIYPSFDKYLDAFAGFVARIPAHGLLVAAAADRHVVEIVRAHAKCDVAWFALQGDDTHGQDPHWLGALVPSEGTGQGFDLYAGGVASGRFAMQLPGAHNARNAIAAIASVCQGFGAPMQKVRASLSRFEGVRRRQDLLGTPRGVFVYDDFAHHPTAVDETLRALRAKHPTGRLHAVFEPRSATACRAMHQQAYAGAFAAADRVVFAPLGRSNIAAGERLDLERLVADLQQRGKNATAAGSVDEILALLTRETQPGDIVALLSNGAFGGIHARLLEALAR